MILWRSILSIGKCDTATSPRQTRAKWHSIQKLPGIHEVSPWLRIPLGDSLQPFHFCFFCDSRKAVPIIVSSSKIMYINLAEFNRKKWKIFMITRKIMENPCFFVFFWYWGYRFLYKILTFGAVRPAKSPGKTTPWFESLPEAVSFSMATRCQLLIKPC